MEEKINTLQKWKRNIFSLLFFLVAAGGVFSVLPRDFSFLFLIFSVAGTVLLCIVSMLLFFLIRKKYQSGQGSHRAPR